MEAASDSEDSAVVRRREAEQRIKDTTTSAAPAAVLPLPGQAFDEVDGPPAFLDPEATRPLADSLHRRKIQHQREQAALAAQAARAHSQAPQQSGQGGDDWDISRMAPQLKSQPGCGCIDRCIGAVCMQRTDNYRQNDGPGVVTGVAVRYKQPVKPSGDAGPRVGDVGPLRPPPEPAAKKRATSSMPVDTFLDKGHGGAALPRRDQGRKDREKNKRARGQSSHSHWKSEAEMVLRQQYD